MAKKKKLKKKTMLELYQSIRKFWHRSPVTQVVPNRKKYNRKRDKQKFKDDLKKGKYDY